MRLRWLARVTVVLALGVAAAAVAQDPKDAPTAMVISYRATAGKRAEFRKVMQTSGLEQFDRWQREGVFESYQALFSAYAASDTPDMFVVLHFHRFSDLGRWQHIEESYPGGLIATAQPLAEADTSASADLVGGSSTAASTQGAQFLVIEYDVTVPMPKYVSYMKGYVIPQFEGWKKAGILSAYSCYANQNPAGAAWSSLIVLEYKDLDALASRDEVKSRVRSELAASDATWKRWSDDKSDIRKEKMTLPAVSLK